MAEPKAATFPTHGLSRIMANKTVLIVDDDPEIVCALALQVRELGLNVQTASDGRDALTLSLHQPPDLLVLDIQMPAIDGLTVCDTLIADHKIPPFPIMILTAKTDQETIRRCVASGAHYCPKDGDLWRTLKPFICKHLEIVSEPAGASNTTLVSPNFESRKDPAPARVLVVDDDPDLSEAIKIRLASCGIDVVQAENGKQGYWMALRDKPDLIITDLAMPEMSGETLIRKLIYAPTTQNIPILVLTGQRVNGETDFAMKRELLSRSSTVAYLDKPVDFDQLLEQLGRHIELCQDEPQPVIADRTAAPQ